LLDKNNSSIRIFKSCQGCHGKSGDRMRNNNIQWSHLSDAARTEVPYNDSLFARFIDDDIKSDGSAAQTGVHWKMTAKEKSDLIQFLKTL
ncbi:MAG TPA: c-type cytochrome, partial [Chitinophagaceae bacterium]|nr:c-type cytochrome [Chitinophagaceae bacterium]